MTEGATGGPGPPPSPLCMDVGHPDPVLLLGGVVRGQPRLAVDVLQHVADRALLAMEHVKDHSVDISSRVLIYSYPQYLPPLRPQFPELEDSTWKAGQGCKEEQRGNQAAVRWLEPVTWSWRLGGGRLLGPHESHSMWGGSQ